MVLKWAALEGRGLFTHDVMMGQAYERMYGGEPMPGLRVVGRGVHVGSAIDDVPWLAGLSLEGESGRDR